MATEHGGNVVFLSDTTVPIETQKAEVKKLKALREHADFSEVQLWESGSGITSRIKFSKPNAAPVAPPAPEPSQEPAAQPAAESKKKK